MKNKYNEIMMSEIIILVEILGLALGTLCLSLCPTCALELFYS